MPPSMQRHFVHNLPSFAGHAQSAIKYTSIGIERLDCQSQAVEKRHGSSECLLKYARHGVHMEWQEESQAPHRETQNRWALALRE